MASNIGESSETNNKRISVQNMYGQNHFLVVLIPFIDIASVAVVKVVKVVVVVVVVVVKVIVFVAILTVFSRMHATL